MKKTHCERGHEQTPENKRKGTRGCRLCANITAGLRRNKDKEKGSEYSHAHALKEKYKMSPEQYKETIRSQGGHCALCPAVVSWGNRKLSVDHDHACCPGKTACGKCNRGILCATCNQRIGRLEEVLECTIELRVKPGTWYEAAMLYIDKYKTQKEKQ